MRLADLVRQLDSFWPPSGAEQWDNPGLAFGDSELVVRRVLLTVDVTPEVITEAVTKNVQLILSHHPSMFRPISSLTGASASSKTVLAAVSANVALYSAHTNADHVTGGVSESLAEHLGLVELFPLDPISHHGRIGILPTPLPLRDFANGVRARLPKSIRGVAVQGNPDQVIRTVAVLAGAGDSFLDQVLSTQSDAYVTSDLRHHPALDFSVMSAGRARPIALLEISHFEAEAVWVSRQVDKLGKLIPQIDFIASSINTDPWDFQSI